MLNKVAGECILNMPLYNENAYAFPLQKDSSVNGGCIFIEIMLENNYTAWMSARYVGWYIGFTKGADRAEVRTRYPTSETCIS